MPRSVARCGFPFLASHSLIHSVGWNPFSKAIVLSEPFFLSRKKSGRNETVKPRHIRLPFLYIEFHLAKWGFNLFCEYSFATDLQMNFNKNATFIYSAWNDAKIHDENGKRSECIETRTKQKNRINNNNGSSNTTTQNDEEKEKKNIAFKSVAVV